MAMVNSEECKKRIYLTALTDWDRISKLFDPPLQLNDTNKIIPKNWKRISKETVVNNGIKSTTRCFDCKPFDDQLRAYVESDDNRIISITIEGE